MKPTPQRIQLSRKKGFNLQAASLALNGLPAVNCARPTEWGNPYRVGRPGVSSAAKAVALFREVYESRPWVHIRAKLRAELRGKNLACWCKPGSPCHADVLLRIANA
jgi:hypothetical protein